MATESLAAALGPVQSGNKEHVDANVIGEQAWFFPVDLVTVFIQKNSV